MMKSEILESYIPSAQQAEQLEYLIDLLNSGEDLGIHIWVTGGYGLDALYGKITRDHRDFDLTVSESVEKDFLTLIKSLGYFTQNEVYGAINKIVYKHKLLPSNFSLEYTTLEKGKMFLESRGIYVDLPTTPIGELSGQKIWVPTLEQFKISIDLHNNLKNELNWEEYPHVKWQKEILRVLNDK